MNSKPHSPDLIADIRDRREHKESWLTIGQALHMDPMNAKRAAQDSPDFPRHLLDNLPAPDRQVSAADIRIWVEDMKLTDKEIATQLGMSREAFARLRSRRGVKRGPAVFNKPATPEQLAQAEKLLDEGYSFSGVAEIVGIGPKAVSKHFPGRGFTLEQSIQASLMARKLKRVGE